MLSLHYGNLGYGREELNRSLRVMGAVVGQSYRAREVIDFFAELRHDLQRRTAGIPMDKRPVCYVGGIAYAGPHGLSSTSPEFEPFMFVSARNAAVSADGRAPRSHAVVSKEKILMWDPEFIFVDISTLRLDANADAGQILAILGPNGAGKTTLLRCINGLITPRQGVVCVEDVEILRLPPNGIARRLGYVAQRNEAGRLNVFDAVLLGRKPHMVWSPSKTDLSKVSSALQLLGLDSLALRYLDELSGGELQKVCIARALVQEPSVLLLDEPTSSLDLKNRLDILALIRRIVREHRMAVVMTLHDINLGFRFADHLLFLKEGHVVTQAEPETVQAETVAAVYDVDVDIVPHNGQRVVIPRPSGEVPNGV